MLCNERVVFAVVVAVAVVVVVVVVVLAHLPHKSSPADHPSRREAATVATTNPAIGLGTFACGVVWVDEYSVHRVRIFRLRAV